MFAAMRTREPSPEVGYLADRSEQTGKGRNDAALRNVSSYFRKKERRDELRAGIQRNDTGASR